jgi:hypothetical protein
VSCAIELLIVRFRTLGVAARWDAGFATAAAQIRTVLAAVEAFVAGDHTIMQVGREFRSRGVITDIASGEHQFSSQAQQRIADRMNFGVQAAAGAPYGLPGPVLATVSVLVDFAMSAVFKDNFSILAEQQPLVEPIEETAEGEAIEILVDRNPVSEFIGQRPPRTPVAQQIPKGIEVVIECRSPAACRYNVIVRTTPDVTLIF